MKIYHLAVLFLSAVASIEANESVQEACPAENRRFLREEEHQNSRGLQTTTIIDNGLIMLGIHDEGHLNVNAATVTDGGQPSLQRTGLKFRRSTGVWYDSTAYGCACEGFGVSAKKVSDGTSFWGGANQSTGGVQNLVAQPIVGTSNSATTEADVTTGPLKITHDYFPSPASPNVYEVDVTLENTSPTEKLTELRYKRVMDWDIPFVIYQECVSVFYASQPDSLEWVHDNGFVSPNPLLPDASAGILFSCPTGGAPCPVFDSGTADHGSSFQYLFKEDDGVTNVSLGPGEKFQFTVLYGAAANKAAADAAISAVGTEIVSYGYPGQDGCSEKATGADGVYFFGFKDVGGDPIFSAFPSSSPTIDCTNNLEAFEIKFTCEILMSLSEQSRLELCKNDEIIYENCPGICNPELCPCEDNPFPFQVKKKTKLCSDIASLPPADQKKQCKNKIVRENCPGTCECNPLGPCDDYPFPFFVGKNPKLCSDIAALPEPERKKECKNRTVKKYCEATCKCNTDEPTVAPTPRPTPAPTKPCKGEDNPEPFEFPGGIITCEKIASMPILEKNRYCRLKAVRKNCPCTCPELCIDIDSPEPIVFELAEDERRVAAPEPELCADIFYFDDELRQDRCSRSDIRGKCPCGCGPPTPDRFKVQQQDDVDKEFEEDSLGRN